MPKRGQVGRQFLSSAPNPRYLTLPQDTIGMPHPVHAKTKRTPKLRTKTFTGCWTCRARRVKCDDGQPQCQRCRRSGWECQGYGMRLGLSETPGGRLQRRQLCTSTPQTREVLSTGVTALLAELDGCSGDNSAQRGPFSVFSANGSESIRIQSTTTLPGSAQRSCLEPDRDQAVDQRLSCHFASDSQDGPDIACGALPDGMSEQIPQPSPSSQL